MWQGTLFLPYNAVCVSSQILQEVSSWSQSMPYCKIWFAVQLVRALSALPPSVAESPYTYRRWAAVAFSFLYRRSKTARVHVEVDCTHEEVLVQNGCWMW